MQLQYRICLKKLTCLPLAITQAAAYINSKGVSVSEYLKLLRSSQSAIIEALSRNFEDGTRYRNYTNAVAKTWHVSFQQIQRDNSTAAGLLAFMSFIEPREIPSTILPDGQSEENRISALGTLSAYAFFTKQVDGKYDLHRLVYIASRNWLNSQGLTQTWIRYVLERIEIMVPKIQYENQALCRELLPHAQRTLDTDGNANLNARWDLCDKVGRSLQWYGRVREALAKFTEREEWATHSLAEDHPDRLTTKHMLV
jgi:hypothetical protein